MHSVVQRCSKVPAGIAAETDRRSLCARRADAAYIPLDLTGGPHQSGPRHDREGSLAPA